VINSTLSRKSFAIQRLAYLVLAIPIQRWKYVENNALAGGAVYLYGSNTLTMEHSTISRKQFAFEYLNYFLTVVSI